MPGGTAGRCNPDPACPPPCPAGELHAVAINDTTTPSAVTASFSMRVAGYSRRWLLSGGMGELSGQVAIVTGGASGIGAASAALLEAAGAKVVVADIQH